MGGMVSFVVDGKVKTVPLPTNELILAKLLADIRNTVLHTDKIAI